MTTKGYNRDTLVDEYRKGGVFASVIDQLASRDREPRNRETRVSTLQGDLSNRFSTDELLQSLKTLQSAQCGTYQRGNPLTRSRFTWHVSALQMAKDVVSTADSTNCVAKYTETTAGQDAEFETHYFPVRPKVRLEVNIRTDMSAAEINNLAEFVKIIAASRQETHP